MLYLITDEVARNGVLQRITSARGFLGHPLQFRYKFRQSPSPTPPRLGKLGWIDFPEFRINL